MADSDDELARTATAPGSSSPHQPAAALGTSLGRYRLERMLGEGGMGVVHAAFDPDLERRVALKVLRTVDGGGEARQRLLREARAMARLTHANVVTVHEVGTAGDRDYVAMELIDGETLAEWLRAEREPEEIVHSFVSAGRGLAAAHAAGLVHRDFKPHNVLRRRDGRIVVTDFGLARGVENSPAIALDETADLKRGGDSTPSSLSGLTATGSVLGTPAYMAPEQWTGGTVGPAADQFAFCVALWEALTGERPFRGDTIEKLKEEVKRGPDALDASKLPRRLRGILRRGLDPDAAKRWPNMDALLHALHRTERRPALVMVGVGAAVAAGLAVVALRGGSSPGCDPPAIDPSHVWSDALAAITPKPLADVFGAHVSRWAVSRATACTADPGTRPAQLHCLDGVLARLDLVRQSFAPVVGMRDEDLMVELVDPSVCLNPSPPRFALAPTPDLVTAFGYHARNQPDDAHVVLHDVQAFAAKPGLDPCARAVAMRSLEETSTDQPEKRSAMTEALASVEQCDDDRLRADILLAAVPYQFELPVIGPKGEAAIRRADAAVQRVAEPMLTARVDFLRAFVASQQEHWKESLDLGARAIDAFERVGMLRRAMLLVAETIELRFNRAEVADFAAARAAVQKWLPVARRLHADKLAEQFERDDALARYSLGDVAGGHAELVRLWHPEHSDEPTRKLDGEVVDRDGKPVAGATVAVARNLIADSVGVPLPMYRRHHGDGQLRVATTDAAGRFTIPDGPEAGAVIAQLGDRRSVVTPLAGHVKLVVEPTRRVAGKVALGKVAHTQAMIVVQDSTDHTNHYELVAPVLPDGTFAIDGVPTTKVQIAVAVESHGFGTQLQYTPIPASREAVTGLTLRVSTTGRTFDVVARSTLTTPLETAQIIIMPGRVQLANVGELIARDTDGIVTQFARHIVGEQAPHDAIDKLHPGDLVAHFTDVPAGEITVCAIGLAGDMLDAEQMRRIQAHVNELELKCQTIGGDAKSVVIAAPPQKRFD